jgi:hypothetical protein
MNIKHLVDAGGNPKKVIAKIGRFTLTQFYGGAVRGSCIQITENVWTKGCLDNWIQLTVAEAWALANELSKWADQKDKA